MRTSATVITMTIITITTKQQVTSNSPLLVNREIPSRFQNSEVLLRMRFSSKRVIVAVLGAGGLLGVGLSRDEIV